MRRNTRHLCMGACLTLMAVANSSHAQEKELPPGHPTVSSPPPASDVIPEVPIDAGTGAAALTWQAPSSWIEEPPANNMRRAQYRIAGEAGDAQCVVYYFGAGQGGDPQANVQRWAGQFVQEDGTPSSEALRTETLEVSGVPVLLSEISGSYAAGSMAGGRGGLEADFMLLGAVAEGPDSNWFFKLTGPRSTVEAHREAFRSMIDSIQTGKGD